MDCNFYREAISARLDGEDQGPESAAVDRHLDSCPSCRQWAREAVLLNRAVRVRPAEPVPDLTARIMAALTAGERPAKAAASTAPVPVGVARLGLFMVAVTQLCLAVPAFLGDDGGAPVHIAHEQGAWFLALAVGLLVVVWQPARAASLLPVMAALAAGLALTMAVDISAGRTQAAAEAPHGLAFLGLGLLWLLAHSSNGSYRFPGRARSA